MTDSSLKLFQPLLQAVSSSRAWSSSPHCTGLPPDVQTDISARLIPNDLKICLWRPACEHPSEGQLHSFRLSGGEAGCRTALIISVSTQNLPWLSVVQPRWLLAWQQGSPWGPHPPNKPSNFQAAPWLRVTLEPDSLFQMLPPTLVTK